MSATRIEWCDETWNPVTGCTRVSEGCRNCYAEAMAGRRLPGGGFTDRTFGEVRCHPERLDQPLHWRKPRAVFTVSMGDLFHERVSFEFRASVFGVMTACSRHTFLVLTKRPENAQTFMASQFTLETLSERIAWEAERCGVILDARGSKPENYICPVPPDPEQLRRRQPWPGWPLPNVWLGTSVEDQRTADERIPLQLQTPAAYRFVSVEPLLAPVDLGPYLPWKFDSYPSTARLDQVIIGGETGPGARPCHVEWIRSLVGQCREASVPCYVKQLGRWPSSEKREYQPGWGELFNDDMRSVGSAPYDGGRSKHADPTGWPEDLRVRELVWRVRPCK